MKNSLFMIAILAFVFAISSPNDSFAKNTTKKSESATTCKDGSKCSDKEKAACEKAGGKKNAKACCDSKKQASGTESKSGNKVAAHGEEGHTCTADCKK